MDCKIVQTEITALLAGEQPEHPQKEIEAHVAGCNDCRQAWDAMDGAWQHLESLLYASVPETLRQRTLQAVHGEATQDVSRAVLSLPRLVGAVGAGVFVAWFFTFLLSLRVDLDYLSTAQLVITATLWSGLLIAAFCWILGHYQHRGVHLSTASLLGVVATALSLVGTFLCPDKTYFDLWEKSVIAGMLNGPVQWGVGYLVFGFVYALLPALIVSVVLGRRLASDLWRGRLVAAGTFVVLLIPAVYLQCASLAVGLLGMWVVGAFGGALGGVLGGVRIRRLQLHHT